MDASDLAERDKKIEEQKTLIGRKDTQIEEQKTLIGRKDTQIEEQKTLIGRKDTQIEEQKALIGRKDTLIEEQKLLIGAKPHESLAPAIYFGFWKEVLEKASRVEGDLLSDEIRVSLEISHELSGTLHVTPFQEAMNMFQMFKSRVESIVEMFGKLRLEEIESIVTIKELERRVNEIISYLTSHGQETDFLQDVNDYATRVLVSETFKEVGTKPLSHCGIS
jgi:hypothetical protein